MQISNVAQLSRGIYDTVYCGISKMVKVLRGIITLFIVAIRKVAKLSRAF